jgi:hypothetical protein
MDLSTYNFPKIKQVDFVFPTFDIPIELLEEAKKRNPVKGIEIFNEVFYAGVFIELQPNLENTWKEEAYKYAFCLTKSFTPKHKDKEIVVGMLFEEILHNE